MDDNAQAMLAAFHDWMRTEDAKKVRLLIASCPLLAQRFAEAYAGGAAFGAQLAAANLYAHRVIDQARTA